MFTPASLRKFLDSSFSGRTTAITELLQNARRAGATCINITYQNDVLTFRDDGCGISSVDTLLTPGASGWSDDVMKKDDPFGLGFRAALLNCEYVAVSSKFGCFGSYTSVLLDGASPVIEAGDFSVTTIALRKPKIPDIAKALPKLARWLPIPVTFNGDNIAHPASWITILDTDQYTLRLAQSRPRSQDLVATVQGLPITMPAVAKVLRPFSPQRVGEYSFEHAPWTLELKQVEARVPDRESLRNPEDFQPLDLVPALEAYIRATDPDDFFRVETCKSIAYLADALAVAVNEHLGLFYDTLCEVNVECVEVSDSGNYNNGRSRTNWVEKGQPDVRHLPVRGYLDAQEDNMVALTWLSKAEPDVDYVSASTYAYPVPAYELEWVIEGDVELTVQLGSHEVKVCRGEITIYPRWVDDDGNVVYTFPAMTEDEVYDAGEREIWLGNYGSKRRVAFQMECHYDYDDRDFIEAEIETFEQELTALITLARSGTDGLMELARLGAGYLPDDVVRIDLPDRGTCRPLIDSTGAVYLPGVQAMLNDYPQLKATLRELLVKEADDAQG